MARKLRSVKLDEISFVGKGDNPEAHVLLLKIKPEDDTNNGKGENEMTPEEIVALQKAKDDAEATVATLTSENETLKACAAEDKKKLEALKAEKFKKEDETDIYKGLPEAIVKKLKDDEARITKMEDENLTREYVAKAAEVTLIGKADEIGDLLKTIAKFSTTTATKVFDLFKTAAARIQEGDLLKEVGKNTDKGSSTACDKIVAKATELRKSHPELSDAQAFTKVYDEDSELRAEYMNERK